MKNQPESTVIGLQNMFINLTPELAKIVLQFNPFTRLKVMCREYSEDLTNFTELVWEDDKNLEFNDRETYPQFQLWL
jgi:hypothetical protein